MTTFTLKNARLSFSALFEKKEPSKGIDGKARYGASFIIPKDHPQIAEIEAAIEEVAKEKWGAKADAHLKAIRSQGNKYCLQDGDLKDWDGYADSFYISSYNDRRPRVVNLRGVDIDQSEDAIQDGDYVLAKIGFWAQDNAYGKAIRAELQGVQFLRAGEHFSAGRVSSSNEFEDLSDGADEDMADLLG